jgi:protein gp37
MSTSIEWVRGADGSDGATWNFARGCSRVDAACTNCYAERMAARFCAPGQAYDGLISVKAVVSGLRYTNPKSAGSWTEPRWAGAARFIPEALSIPLKWRKGRRIFPCSMSDAFHESLTNEQIAAAFGVMAATPQHTYVMTTKRAKGMREWFAWAAAQRGGARQAVLMAALDIERETHPDGDAGPLHTKHCADPIGPWPLPNVHLGVSAGTQASADNRIADLLETPAVIRWVSLEPLLEDVDISNHLRPAKLGQAQIPALDWVVLGSESGPGARAMDIGWAAAVVEQCRDSGTPLFIKQIANDQDRKGGDPAFWPAGDWPRQYPAVVS